jgi:hypothetical protein
MGASLFNPSIAGRRDRAGGIAVPFRLEVHYDGVTGRKWAANLPENEIWIDGSAFMRPGVNIGPTFQNYSASPIAIYATLGDRNLPSLQQRDTTGVYAGIAAKMQWVTLNATLAAGAQIQSGQCYDIYRIVFTTTVPGSCLISSV